ncbi:PREDICTED: proline-, glutamic acid- and leucine-rich protein 1-like [Ipomoea nil]|uniref:proline-, glutamic acid- and leucine-rich protein 1-like n=1 Tax=Ipomoea nil TaxID=35883 RepID=UPI000901C758|nr:PREDICTED: proline-, glutamic acid- and leucine-rich protein 1-like [Ipomoea nil]XP_019174522.1 PREDICTED: proline-, glutamic acid- and leucine-rich protein 1-like [Ipomoea nil]XP_019174524.1 PREDICTED: proline-, glutamic acid- and leucine-rich protein 1-like [Ipomoea nil]
MLLKQSSSRNLRAKGFKLKHGFQICVVLALCIWLLYQVNKSYSKKGGIEGGGSEVSGQGGGESSRLQILKLGRKGLNPEIEDEEEDAGLKLAGDDEPELDDEEKKVRAELEDEERKLRENEGDDDTDGGELDKAEEQLEDLIGEEDKEE